MLITPEFNRLYHACFLKDLYDQMIHCHRLVISFKKFKDALKYANKDYPRYNVTNDIVSTRDIRSGDLIKHIEWIRLYAAEYGFTLSIDEKSYNRMMELAHAMGYK